MKIPSGSWRRASLRGLSLLAGLFLAKTASAEVTLVETDGWKFAADGRVNAFFSLGWGDDFPEPSPNPNGPDAPGHTVLGGAGQQTRQADANNDYFTMRVRNGFVGNVLGFSLTRNVTETTTAKGYIGLWSVVESKLRSRRAFNFFDAREGYVRFDGPWGTFLAGRTLGLFGRTSTDINYLYGHAYGLGYPCGDERGPTCGHIGTGVMFPGFAPGFLYSTPSLGGLQFHAAVYDPVRLLGAWNKAAYPRPEAGVTFEHKFSPSLLLKLGAEGVFQQVSRLDQVDPDGDEGPLLPGPVVKDTTVWGASAGGRFEAGPFRLGVAGFHGKGLGFYYALQNSPAVHDTITKELRTFTGLYAQAAVVLDRFHFAAGAGRVTANQLDVDVANPQISTVKSQTGVSAGVFYRVTDNFHLGLDYFLFQTDWYGAANSVWGMNAAGNPVAVRQPGVIDPEKQRVDFLNLGATFLW